MQAVDLESRAKAVAPRAQSELDVVASPSVSALPPHEHGPARKFHLLEFLQMHGRAPPLRF